MGWEGNGTEKYVPWTTLQIGKHKLFWLSSKAEKRPSGILTWSEYEVAKI